MKKILCFFLVTGLMSVVGFTQNADDLICVFKKNKDDKVFTKNNEGIRYANFIISGIKSDEQASVLAENVRNNDFIHEFTISNELGSNERSAYLALKPDTKIADKYDILIANGIDFIKIDDKIINVANYKVRMDRKNAKMQDNNAYPKK